MKKVFIKYNPYNLETEITVDGKKLAQNSKIGERIVPGTRLQEWIEDLPRILVDEYNDKDFDITFHGTLLDFEDLTEVFTQAYERGELTAKLDRIPAKETSDKEALISKTVTNAIVLTPSDTNDLPYGKYVYDLQLNRANGYVETIITPSTLIIGEEVTF